MRTQKVLNPPSKSRSNSFPGFGQYLVRRWLALGPKYTDDDGNLWLSCFCGVFMVLYTGSTSKLPNLSGI